jgi:subtilisin family serine protease
LTTIRRVAAMLAALLPLTMLAPTGAGLAASNGDATDHVVVFEGHQLPADLDSRIRALNGSVEKRFGQVGVATVRGLDDAGAAALRATSGVFAVERDVILAAEDDGGGGDGSVTIENDSSPGTAQFFSRQWNLKAIGAEAGWPREPSNSTVKAFVVDTGIDYRHPDLEGRVDLALSKSFVTEAVPAGRLPFTDMHSHGTAIAGLIASNAKHLAGVTRHTTLVAVKVHDKTRMAPVMNYVEGILYAAENGADVIHLSVPTEFSKGDRPGLVASINRAVNLANRKGAVMVAAAGNAMYDFDHNEDEYRFCNAVHVICSSATAPTAAASVNGPWTDWDAIAPYTNFGRSTIDIAGPGGVAGVGRNVTLTCSRVSQATMPAQQPCVAGGLTWTSTGTSFGAGATSGLAALLVSIVGKGQPAQIQRIITQSAVEMGEPGKDPYYGHGRIDVRRAIAAATP